MRTFLWITFVLFGLTLIDIKQLLLHPVDLFFLTVKKPEMNRIRECRRIN